ncbi:MAG: dioxygenase [Deltaproteobacteria bacterium]|nr:dioxygenase [Deltaproteobacteria bacterium]
MPVIFAAHGAPMLLDDSAWIAELAAWAERMPKPKAVLVVSAHWDERPAAIGATEPLPLIYDFYGFPEKFYRLQYPSPGAPELARRVEELLRAQGLGAARQPERGLDHGSYVPLLAMYPAADVPVLQLSLPGTDPRASFELGRTLAPLRQEGVLLFGSGFLVHNLRYAFQRGVPAWASEFDAWAADALARHDSDALIDFRAKAPGARIAHPTIEHYVPALVSAGAAADDASKVSFPITGWWMGGPMTRRSVQYG